MNKVIGTKRYDTNGATLVGSKPISGTVESLYRKRTGEHFMHFVDECGETLIPIPYKTAESWARSNLDPVRFSENFEAQGGRTVLCIEIPADLKRAMIKKAGEDGVTQTHIIAEALAEYLN